MGGTDQTFADNASNTVYSDTIVGFDEAAGDHIHLEGGHTVASSQLVNGTDTLIKLSDGSTILLKWVSHVDNSIFN
jgi:hypothetical protein